MDSQSGRRHPGQHREGGGEGAPEARTPGVGDRPGARFYSADLGRFLQPDSIVPSADNPQALNRYSYAGNNPLRYADPSGNYFVDSEGNRVGPRTCGRCGIQRRKPIRIVVTEDTFRETDDGYNIPPWTLAPGFFTTYDVAPGDEAIGWGITGGLIGISYAWYQRNTIADAASDVGQGLGSLFSEQEDARSPGEIIDGLEEGRSPGVRVVPSEEELRKVFEELSEGGKPTEKPSYPGEMVEHDDGTLVGLRIDSKSGGPAIDVRLPSGDQMTVHVDPWPPK